MRGSEFDELQFFEAIQSSRARALLIGRRALVLIGLPVLTADYGGVQIPSVEDLVLTKRFAARPKDLEDIRLLPILQSEREP